MIQPKIHKWDDNSYTCDKENGDGNIDTDHYY